MRRVIWVVLLLACAAAAGASAQEAHSDWVLRDPVANQELYQQLLGEPRTWGCWKTLRKTEGCAESIFKSIKGGHPRLTSDCCKTVVNLGEYCIHKIFRLPPPIGAVLPWLIKHSCNALPPSKIYS